MKILVIALFCLQFILPANAQSWLVEGHQQYLFESFSQPIELNNGNIFVCYSNYDLADNGTNADSSRQYAQIRTHEGQLLQSKRIFKADTRLYMRNAVKFNDQILVLLFWYSFKTNKNYGSIQLLDENLEPVFEKIMDFDDSFFYANDIYIESDTTAIILMNFDPITKFIRISNTGIITQDKMYYDRTIGFVINIIENFNNDSFAVMGFHDISMFDKNFNPIYIKELPFYTTDGWGSVLKYKDSHYFWLRAYEAGLADIGLIKFNKKFEAEKIVRIGDTQRRELVGWGNFYNPKASNSVYMIGVPDSPPLVLVNVPLIITRLDTNLNIIWTKYYDNNHLNGSPTIYATSDNGILLAGAKRDITDPNLNPIAYLLKIDSSGNFPTATKNKKNDVQWSAIVFPNPSPGYLTISIDETQKDLKLELYDEKGCIVFHSKSLQVGKNSFDLSFLPQGIYFYSILFDGKERAKGKWVKN